MYSTLETRACHDLGVSLPSQLQGSKPTTPAPKRENSPGSSKKGSLTSLGLSPAGSYTSEHQQPTQAVLSSHLPRTHGTPAAHPHTAPSSRKPSGAPSSRTKGAALSKGYQRRPGSGRGSALRTGGTSQAFLTLGFTGKVTITPAGVGVEAGRTQEVPWRTTGSLPLSWDG